MRNRHDGGGQPAAKEDVPYRDGEGYERRQEAVVEGQKHALFVAEGYLMRW